VSAHPKSRSGFSLMEMVIATAVLAGSGVALFALVGQASQLARKAEERTVALQLAQSTLDEFLAGGSDAETETETETEGTFESDPRWSYRIEQSDIRASGQSEVRLKKIVVSIYRSSESSGAAQGTTDSAIVSLVRWLRAAKSNTQSSLSPLESMAPERLAPQALGSP